MRWKMILGITLAVVVVVVVTAFLILATYDFSKFKPQITDLAKQYTGRELVIGGDIELGISLLPTLVVSDVTFQNAAWAKNQHMAKIKRLEIQITGIIGQLSGVLDPEEQWPLNLTIAALDSKVSLDGHVVNITEAKGIDLKLGITGSDIGNFQQLTGEPLPVRGPFEVAGHLTADTLDHFKISGITVLLAGSNINGVMALSTTSAKPQIDATFRSTKLDLRPFLREDRSDAKTEKKSKKTDNKSDKVFPSELFDLQSLQQINANFSFAADQILAHRFALDEFKLESSLKDGNLIVKPMTTRIGGGDFSGSLDVSTGGGNVNLTAKITATKINLGEMLKNLDIMQSLDGVLDVAINLNGQGKSVADLMGGLDGDVAAILTEGKMPVEYLNLVGADLTSSILKIVNPFEKKIERAQINCAVCDFNIKDGLAKSDVIMIDDPEKTLFSSGTLNLKTEGLDFGIHTKPKEGIGTKETGKVSVSLGVITRPFKLGGTLGKPSLGLSPERAAKTIGQAIVGPGGLASLFLSHSSDKESPCAAALKIVGEGAAKTEAKPEKEKKPAESGNQKKEGIGSKIKKLFD